MGRHPYLWIRKQYCYNANTSPIDLQIQLTPIKIPADFFEKSDKLFLKFIQKSKGGGFKLPNFKVYYRVTVIKTVWCRHKSKPIEQWNRIQNLETNPYIYGQLTSDKDAKMQKTVFSTNALLHPDTHMQKMVFALTSYHTQKLTPNRSKTYT